MNTKHPIVTETHRNRVSYVVGPIRTYDWDEAMRLANDSDEPIEQPAEPVVVVDYTNTVRMRCLTTLSRPEARGDIYATKDYKEFEAYCMGKDSL